MKKTEHNLIPSFQVDHTRILPGIYESRIDGIGGSFVTTFDIRMKRPNVEPAIHPNAMHTIEHVVATFLRNDAEWRERIVYWGPMGCLTGFYLIIGGRPKTRDILPLVLRAFEYLRCYDGPIPGATPKNCGNFILHDLNMAKFEAGKFVKRLKKSPCLEYPLSARPITEKGSLFFDS